MNSFPVHPSMQAEKARLDPVDAALVANRGRDGMVVVLDIASGKRRPATIVDAREMLALGTAQLCNINDGSLVELGGGAEPERNGVSAPVAPIKTPGKPKPTTSQAQETADASDALEQLDIHALRRLAKDAGIDGTAIRSMTKTQLVNALQGEV